MNKLTSHEQVCLESSRNEKEWNHVCGLIRFARAGELPSDWMEKVIGSGLADEVAKTWAKPDIFQKRQINQTFYDYVLGQIPI